MRVSIWFVKGAAQIGADVRVRTNGTDRGETKAAGNVSPRINLCIDFATTGAVVVNSLKDYDFVKWKNKRRSEIWAAHGVLISKMDAVEVEDTKRRAATAGCCEITIVDAIDTFSWSIRLNWKTQVSCIPDM
jgi:hypothetical protein